MRRNGLPAHDKLGLVCKPSQVFGGTPAAAAAHRAPGGIATLAASILVWLPLRGIGSACPPDNASGRKQLRRSTPAVCCTVQGRDDGAAVFFFSPPGGGSLLPAVLEERLVFLHHCLRLCRHELRCARRQNLNSDRILGFSRIQNWNRKEKFG